MKHYLCIVLFLALFQSFCIGREQIEVQHVTSDIVLDDSVDYHVLSSSDAISSGVKIDICSTESWLFFDNIKPDDFLSRFSSSVTINGEPLKADVNARVSLYRLGTVVTAHPADYCPLTTFTEHCMKGESDNYTLLYYYTNCPPDSAPANLVRSLRSDNSIRSFKLKRGYMATFATNADGMGYSRVYIADKSDLEIPELPMELDGKVSFVRVFRWHYTSKKGWAGSKWPEMPEGLKYAPEQANLTNSTWYYNWGSHPTINPLNAQKSYNQEYVPEKWGAGGMWNGVYTIEDACHLMGYNEPDHTEQSNVSVEKAIEEWPLMMKTGMRLGSPATTDFSWLYSFMNQCRQRHYRVDYVVIHAYWGGLSASEWYDRLKNVHERTKRPLWIKEWNNGANWTKESWPSSQSEQYAKQLRDLTDIVNMLDTCSFIERYSIYNWVEDKRMIIDKTGKLTPAGEFYAGNNAPYFYNPDNDVVMDWRFNEAPVLMYDSITSAGNLSLSWTDTNGEQVGHFCLYEDGNEILSTTASRALLDMLPANDVSYTVSSVPEDDSKSGLLSNSVKLSVSNNNAADWLFADEMVLREKWQPLLFRNPLSSSPLAFAGVATYRNKLPLTARLRRVTPKALDARLRTWEYQLNPSFYNPDTLAVMLMPAGRYTDGSMKMEAKTVEGVDEKWKSVAFDTSFEDIPVVVLSAQESSSDTAFAICVRNVTRYGFEVRLRYEGRLHKPNHTENLAYLAVSEGCGSICGRRIEAGYTNDASVGSSLTEMCQVVMKSEYAVPPMIFAQMVTENDTITSTLRLQRRGTSSFTIFKDREKSVAHELVKPEKVGWIAVGKPEDTGVNPIVASTQQAACLLLSGKNFDGYVVPERGTKYIGKKKGIKNESIKLFNY